MPKKITQEYVHKYFKEQGCELLDNYKDATTKLNFRCSCGNLHASVFNNFKNGSRCKHCGFNVPTQEFVESYFKSEGCELLDTYKNSNLKLKFKCSCGDFYSMNFRSFKNGHRCKKCGFKKHNESIKGSGNPNYREDQEEMKKEKENDAKHRYILEECKNKNGKIRQLDIDRLGYSSLELWWKITSHPNFEHAKNNKFTIDHIFPIIAFYKIGITDPKIVNTLDNLQPLSDKQNIKKAGKFDEVKFLEYLKSKNLLGNIK